MTENCIKCDSPIVAERVHLGYDHCTDCSETTAYKAHVVYPHKTGAVVQPIKTTEQADQLSRLDRRSAKKNKKAYGQYTSNSWDTWLKQYHAKQNAPVKRRVHVVYEPVCHMSKIEVLKVALQEFNKLGYDKAVALVNNLYTQDKMSLVTKSNVVSHLAKLHVTPKRLRPTPDKYLTHANARAMLVRGGRLTN